MKALIVKRGLGDLQGPDIVEAMLSTTGAKLARGRQEIDEFSSSLSVTLEILHTVGLIPGLYVEVQDPIQGPNWVGKIESVQHARNGPIALTTVRLHRPVIL
jgi:hypothetical protein